ncbi:MAG: primosomal protein N' [Flavobacteriia bacterium]|nr:primosomal protein N' [Flavobacteriia bacterium]
MSERKTLFADVILPVPVHQLFTYRIPFELNDVVFAGIRVVVPFGKAKLVTGIVIKVHEEIPTNYQAKYIEHVLDDTPIITKNQFQLWQWIADYYMAPIGDVMNAALPSNFKLASETKIVLHPDFDNDYSKLDDRQYQIVEALEIRETLDLKEISEIVGIKTIQPIIKILMDKKVVFTLEELNDKFIPKTAIYIQLNENYSSQNKLEDLLKQLEEKKSTQKQLNNLLIILKEGNYSNGLLTPVLRKQLEMNGASISTLNTLEKNGYISQERFEISRLKNNEKDIQAFKTLSSAQQKALNEVRISFESKQVCLLHGVTGSGKTEIYVELIQEQINNGKQVLFLLPEIALTTQLITRLSAYFGSLIGVYHSKFNQNERVEIWNQVLNNNPNQFRIILGARSSVFLPFSDLGLIIVDEEHESSFKQYDPSPRYNARDCAIVLAHMTNAKVLLGSATPAIETYYNAKNGKYGLIELHDRFGGLKLPEIFCADVKKERKNKSLQSHFTSFLMEHIRVALNNKEQIILFQNRRGYTPLWMCEICNWTPKCKNCDVSLTYHKQTNTLKCHYCGHFSPPVGTCNSCGSNRLKMLGFGTEKIEDDISLMFPNVRVHRMDLDTTRSKNAYENIIQEFENRNVDVLIGTQMVTKGLDFDNVSLVGILDADMLMNRSDFRALERSYQLMSQVAGRSGRKGKRGTVVIQTGDPDHWVIQKIIQHDYIGFYESEIIERKNFFYPPFYKLIEFTLKHKDQNVIHAAANEFANSLKVIFKERVMGPEFPVVSRVNNYHIKVIKLKIERDAPEKKIKERINELISSFYSAPVNKSIRMSIDVDPA